MASKLLECFLPYSFPQLKGGKDAQNILQQAPVSFETTIVCSTLTLTTKPSIGNRSEKKQRSV